MRRRFQFVAVLTALMLVAMPVMACFVPDTQMTAEEHSCCQKMAHTCEVGVMPSSHSCCRHPVSAQDVNVSKICALDVHLGNASVVVALTPPLSIGSDISQLSESPPEIPPKTITILRI